MIILAIFFCLLVLVLLITVFRINAFLAFLIVSILAGCMLGMPLASLGLSIQKGMGDTLGSVIIIISLGAMLGKLIATSGAAQRIAFVFMNIFGKKYITWALALSGIIIGIPLFYGVGFVLMVPLIFSITFQYKLPAVATGLPMLAALSVTHGFLPPHPSPVALVQQFHASMGQTLIYGLMIALPTVIIAGPLFGSTLKKITAEPLATFRPEPIDDKKLPGAFTCFATALLPVFLFVISSALLPFFTVKGTLRNVLLFLGDGNVVMLISLITATLTLGLLQGRKITNIMTIYQDAVKDITMILLIIGGAGALKQVLTDSNITPAIAHYLQNINIQPLLLGWLITALIRICIGSATVAGLTAAGIIYPFMIQSHTNPNLMVLSIGAGSLVFSHVNDSGFWLFKEYFNLTLKQTFLSWTIMETIVAVCGLAGVLLLNQFI